MTNLDSILKSRDITLSTKVRLVKAMVFPAVTCECESWAIKNAECRRIDAFELWCWRRLLRVLWTARRSNQFILKELSPKYSLEGLMLKLKLQDFGHLMQRTDSLEKTSFLPSYQRVTTVWNLVYAVTHFFLGSKIIVDNDCSLEIKRRLLLGRKAMTNLDSILKSRDISLLAKVCVVKAVIFPVVMYGFESWTIRKAEHWRTVAFELWCWRRLENLSRKSNQSILKEINLEYSLEELILKLKLQYFGYLMRRPNSLEKTLMLGKLESKRRIGWQKMRWLDSITEWTWIWANSGR